tara:strand:- start:5391 stop:5828 length:438 start_codon:yes stop_codon:yes gene_type:complete
MEVSFIRILYTTLYVVYIYYLFLIIKKVIKLFMKPLAKIYYAKPDTVVYFLNTIDGIDEVNTGHLDNKGAYYPINALTGEFVFLQKTDQLSWGDKCFYASNRNGLYIFLALNFNILFAIYGNDLGIIESDDCFDKNKISPGHSKD